MLAGAIHRLVDATLSVVVTVFTGYRPTEARATARSVFFARASSSVSVACIAIGKSLAAGPRTTFCMAPMSCLCKNIALFAGAEVQATHPAGDRPIHLASRISKSSLRLFGYCHHVFCDGLFETLPIR